MSETLERLESWLTEQIAAGDLSLGVQLVVDIGGDRITDLALGCDGTGRPVGHDSLVMVRCAAAKPLLALGIASLVDAGRLAWRTKVGDLIEGAHPAVAAITVMELLNHTAGLHATPGAELSMYRPDARRRIVMSRPPPAGWRVGTDCEFAEAASGTVLGMIIEAVAARAYDDYLAETIIEPLGLTGSIVMRSGDGPDTLDRIAVNCWRSGDRTVALLMERTTLALSEWNPAYGAYASARGLAGLYRAVLDGRAQVSPESLATLTSRADTGGPYAAGFAVDLRDFYVHTPVPADSFGHGGNGVSLALAVPSLDLVLAVNFVGQLASKDAAIVRFSRTVELVCEHVTSGRP